MATYNRYNPNYGKGINSSNAWKLTTVRGGEWAAMKNAEGRASGGAKPSSSTQTAQKPSVDSQLQTDLMSAADNGQGITRKELSSIIGKALNGEADLTGLQRQTLKSVAQQDGTFARSSTQQIAMEIAQGTPVAVAATKYALCCC